MNRLLDTETAPLGMFFFHVDQVYRNEGRDQASALMSAALERCPRIINDSEFIARKHLLEPKNV